MKKPLKKRHILLVLLPLIIAFILFLMLALKIRYYLLTFSDPRFFSSLLSRELGYPVNVGGVTVNYMGKLILHNVEVGSSEPEKAENKILTIHEIRVSFNPWKVAQNPHVEMADSIELREPDLNLTQESIQLIKKKQEGKKPAEIPPMVIKSGSLKFTYGPDDTQWSFYRINGRIRRREGGALDVQLKAKSGDLSESWDLKGTFPLSGQKQIKLEIEDLNLSSFLEKLKLDIKQPVSGKVKVVAENRESDLWKGTLKSDEIQVGNIKLSQLSSNYNAEKKKLLFSDAAFVVYGGNFKGSGNVDLEVLSINMVGDFKDIPLESLENPAEGITLKGRLSGSIDASMSGNKISAKGSFQIPAGACTTVKFSDAKGNYLVTPDFIAFSGVTIKTTEGSFAIDGKKKKKNLFLSIKSDTFNPSEWIKDLPDLKIPKPGSFDGKLKGTALDNYELRGFMKFPVILLGKREIKDLNLNGGLRVDKDEYLFDGFQLNIGNKSFPLYGKIKKEGEKRWKMSLINLSPDILEPFTDLEVGDYITLKPPGDGMNLFIETNEKTSSGKIMMKNGSIRGYPFSGIHLNYNNPKGGPTIISGTIKGKDIIGIIGKIDKELTNIQCSSKRFSVTDVTFSEPRLNIVVKDGVTTGDLSSDRMSYRKEIIEIPKLKFVEKSPGTYSLSGSLLWNSSPFDISGTVFSKKSTFTLSSDNFNLESLNTGGKRRFSGRAKINLYMTSKGGVEDCSIWLKSDKAFIGEKKLPSFTANIDLDNDKVIFKSLELKNKESVLLLTGFFKYNLLYLESPIRDQTLDELAKFLDEGGAPSDLKLKLTGTIFLKGPPDKLELSFEGTGANLSYKEFRLGSGKLSFSSENDSIKGKFTPENPDLLIASLMPSAKKGELSSLICNGWKNMIISFFKKDKKLLHLNGKSMHETFGKVEFDGDFKEKGWDITLNPQKLVLKNIVIPQPEMRLINDGEKTVGKIKSSEAKFDSSSVINPQLSFEENEGGTILFAGNCVIYDSEASITGESRDGTMDARIKIPELNVKLLDADKIGQNKLQGIARFEATIKDGKDPRFSIDSQNLKWGDKKLPRIFLEGQEKKDLLFISALKVYIEDKPVCFTGNVYMAKQTCVLNGKIDSLSIPYLIDLIGGKCPDIVGYLSGALAIEGKIADPEFRYEGRILNLVYKGKNMGDGKIKVSGTKSDIKGRLDLDNPPKAITGISDANVEISYYFDLSGTPKNFVITPHPLGTKVNVNPAMIWKLFQLIP